jgi:hypothetical protein
MLVKTTLAETLGNPSLDCVAFERFMETNLRLRWLVAELIFPTMKDGDTM